MRGARVRGGATDYVLSYIFSPVLSYHADKTPDAIAQLSVIFWPIVAFQPSSDKEDQPYIFGLAINKSWFATSKALHRSIRKSCQWSQWSKSCCIASSQSSNILISTDSFEWCGLNLDCVEIIRIWIYMSVDTALNEYWHVFLSSSFRTEVVRLEEQKKSDRTPFLRISNFYFYS